VYREGFTVCSDCGIALVFELPIVGSEPSYFLLWEGEDPVLHDSLTEELRTEHIHYVDTPLDVYRRGSSDPLRFKRGPKFGFAVSVHESDRKPAIRILERLLEIEPSEAPWERLLPPEPSTVANELLHANARDNSAPSVELCAGDDANAREFLENALTKVGITSRRVGGNDAPTTLLVRADDEVAAKEIQISGASAPREPAPEPSQSVWYADPAESYSRLWVICRRRVFLWLVLFVDTARGLERFVDVRGCPGCDRGLHKPIRDLLDVISSCSV